MTASLTATAHHAQSTAFADVLDSIEVDTRSLTASVAGDPVTADDVRQLETELGRRLYERLHVRWPVGRDSLARVDRDLGAESRIAAAVPDVPVPVRVRDVRREGGDVTATMFGARVVLDDVPTGDTVLLPSGWPALSPGFHLVFGPARPGAAGREADALWRVYLAAETFEDGLTVFGDAVAYLRANVSAWQAKMASSPAWYPRTDAVTVYLGHDERHHADALADAVSSDARWHRTSAFVATLRPGVGLAQEPDDPDRTRRSLSYGQHRATVLARLALDGLGADAVPAALTAAGVDPIEFWRNTTRRTHRR
ncbi:T3SS effector HopA1 family protein [Rhodococcoides corynebacterioides]|uniref:T3SS effector HopA1 family protein n=1 Tax=Rhodococcoides corynebacterioides TaxID=53972 RepID=UPI003AEA4F01